MLKCGQKRDISLKNWLIKRTDQLLNCFLIPKSQFFFIFFYHFTCSWPVTGLEQFSEQFAPQSFIEIAVTTRKHLIWKTWFEVSDNYNY